MAAAGDAGRVRDSILVFVSINKIHDLTKMRGWTETGGWRDGEERWRRCRGRDGGWREARRGGEKRASERVRERTLLRYAGRRREDGSAPRAVGVLLPETVVLVCVCLSVFVAAARMKITYTVVCRCVCVRGCSAEGEREKRS